MPQHDYPTVDGEAVIFRWEGETAPYLKGDFNQWQAAAAIPLQSSSPGVWTHRHIFPHDTYVEYGYFMQPDDKKSVLDPLNMRRRVSNGVGGHNHFFYMPEAAPTSFTQRRIKGHVTKHRLEHKLLFTGGARTVYLYQPPTDELVPLVVVWDGVDYLRRAHLTAIVDHLIAAGRIRPLALAMIDNGKSGRFLEYMQNEATLGMLSLLLMPLAKTHLNLLDAAQHPGAYGVMGASMGGLMALYTGLRLPNIFGRVIAQSGAYHFASEGGEMLVHTLIRAQKPITPFKIWLDVGTFDWLIQTNHGMRDHLVSHGYDVTYHEYNAGHNYTAWGNSLWRGLETLFPLEAK